MIDAKELRIGNYVKNITSELPYSTIFGITEEYPYLNEITAFEVVYENLEGIPITEEWLLRFDWNGYKQFSINSYFAIDTKGCVWYCGDFTGIVVEFVHQLQNLYFALTGKELEPKE